MKAKLLVLRKRGGYTQTELAEKIGISQVWYSLLETGSVPMSKRIRLALCYVLNCKEDDLIDTFEDRAIKKR